MLNEKGQGNTLSHFNFSFYAPSYKGKLGDPPSSTSVGFVVQKETTENHQNMRNFTFKECCTFRQGEIEFTRVKDPVTLFGTDIKDLETLHKSQEMIAVIMNDFKKIKQILFRFNSSIKYCSLNEVNLYLCLTTV